jgi:hypothetical protein
MVSLLSITLLTQYPQNPKCDLITPLFHKISLVIRTALFPSKNSITKAMRNFEEPLIAPFGAFPDEERIIFSRLLPRQSAKGGGFSYDLTKNRLINELLLGRFSYANRLVS